MSRLEDLIQELCPNGVEYKPLKEVSEIKRGVRVTKRQLASKGKYPVYQNSLIPLGYSEEFNCLGPNPFLICAGAAGDIGYSLGSFWAADDCFWFDCSKVLNNRYLYHVLLKNHSYFLSKVRKASIPRLPRISIENLLIPVPPLEVQEEIVRLLDTFIQLTTEFINELTNELTARKQQYEYYRDQLLTFDDSVKFTTIENISKKITSGGTPKSGNLDYYDGNIPWLRTQEVDWNNIESTQIKITEKGLAHSSAKWIPINCVIVAMYGATAGKVAINKIPLTTNQACCNLEINEEKALYRYVYHWLSHKYKELKSLGQGSQSNINAKVVRQFPIPIPSLEEQEQIVAILDRFDALCNDLTLGLPAEIEARQKQYEYYRDKLLSFKELKDE